MNQRPEILVVDDDRKTVDLLRLYLERAGYGVRVAYDGRQALELAREQPPDLVVLDLMLPQVHGLDVCHALREGAGPSVPIIMLTARTTEEDKLLGLETGADDYVVKPFSPRELVARVNAVLRRTGTHEGARDSESRFGELVVDHVRHEVRVRSEPVRLTLREFRLLEALAREPGRAFTRLGLLERAFGFDYEGQERTVDVHVANLRKKIEPNPGRPIYVLTVPGVGYKLAADPAREEAHRHAPTRPAAQ